jgi:ABC-2 type transport system permease protein
MWAIYKKELKSYFLSPIGYISIGIFMLIYSIFFYVTTWYTGTVDMGNLYYATARYGLLLIVPIITMRMFSEEKKNGTEQLLLTSPKSVSSIVLGKFLASVTVVLITVIFSIIYSVIVSFFGTINIPTILITMLGFVLVAMAAISIGMLVSSLTENQIVSAIITIAILIAPWFLEGFGTLISSIDLIDKFMKFPYGLISIADIVSLLSITIACILITIILIKRKKAVN